MSNPTCDRCGGEIRPGQKVNLVGADPDERIILSEEALLVHADENDCRDGVEEDRGG